jgi:hypothetical protein
MMIDVNKEDLLTLTEATTLLPGRSGKHRSLPTLYRWCSIGVRRNNVLVKLDSIVIGGARYTSREALTRFITSCNEVRGEKTGCPLPRSLQKRYREAKKAGKELKRRQRRSRRNGR